MPKIKHPVANDNPAHVNQKVSIIRSEHGWYDGNLSGEVVEANCLNGKWIYKVRVEEEYGKKLSKVDQFVVDVNHTRDLRF